jgi:hypothetical protein
MKVFLRVKMKSTFKSPAEIHTSQLSAISTVVIGSSNEKNKYKRYIEC